MAVVLFWLLIVTVVLVLVDVDAVIPVPTYAVLPLKLWSCADMFAVVEFASVARSVRKPGAPLTLYNPCVAACVAWPVVPLNECLWVGSEMVVVDVLVLEAVAVFG